MQSVKLCRVHLGGCPYPGPCFEEKCKDHRETYPVDAPQPDLSFHRRPPEITAANPVTAPAHYTVFKIQPIEFILANGLSFLQASVLKYLCRYPYKNGMEDLLKCRDMLDRLIEVEKSRV